jgi:hypothetical protein
MDGMPLSARWIKEEIQKRESATGLSAQGFAAQEISTAVKEEK